MAKNSNGGLYCRGGDFLQITPGLELVHTEDKNELLDSNLGG